MAKKPSHVSRVSLSHLVEIGLKKEIFDRQGTKSSQLLSVYCITFTSIVDLKRPERGKVQNPLSC
jgi:hypothetical protein